MGKITGVSEIRDESNKNGLRIIIEVKKNNIPEIILNNLYKKTQLESIFSINMLALVKQKPQLLDLKSLIKYFIYHRKEVIYKRCIHELNKFRNKIHIMEGIIICLSNIDDVIKII